MSFRLPQNLDPWLAPDRAAEAFHAEVLAEKAAALGRAGKAVAARLAALRAAGPDADREALLHAAADATHDYLIQRELCGLFTHQGVIEDYEIPRAVLARVGARRRSG